MELPHPKFCSIAVMAKASKPGRTKTRLSPPLTPDEAARFNTSFLKDIADNLLAAAERVSLTGAMAFGPPGHDDFFREHLPGGIALHEIWFPDFGECLSRALLAQFAEGHKAAGVLNSDSPTLPVSILSDAVTALAEPGDRVVIGPSNDGGYYFLGCKTVHARLFEDIAWSTDVVFRQTLDRAAEIGVPVYLLPEWYDVDDAAALRILIGELLDGHSFSEKLKSSPAVNTRMLLTHFMHTADLGSRLSAFEPHSLQTSHRSSVAA